MNAVFVTPNFLKLGLPSASTSDLPVLRNTSAHLWYVPTRCHTLGPRLSKKFRIRGKTHILRDFAIIHLLIVFLEARHIRELSKCSYLLFYLQKGRRFFFCKLLDLIFQHVSPEADYHTINQHSIPHSKIKFSWKNFCFWEIALLAYRWVYAYHLNALFGTKIRKPFSWCQRPHWKFSVFIEVWIQTKCFCLFFSSFFCSITCKELELSTSWCLKLH